MSFWSIAQKTDSLNSKIVLEKSYELYLEQKWDSLQDYGKVALKKGIDFYYLRMRLGISYYEQKKYRLAEEHFYQAIEFNDLEDLPKEFLYFCYLYTEQYNRARKLRSGFSADLLTKTKKFNPKKLSLIYAEYGKKRSSLDSLTGNMRYIQAGLIHQLGKGSSMTHGYTNLGLQNFSIDFTQHQYFINTNLVLNNKWTLSPTIHLINLRREWEVSDSITTLGKKPQVQESELSHSYISASILATYKIRSLDINPEISLSNIDNELNFQPSLWANFYPFSNHKFSIYVNPSAIYNIQDNWRGMSKYGITYNPFSFLRFTAEYYHGNADNLLENNGTLVYNTIDITHSRLTLSTNITIRRKLGLYLVYQSENKTQAFSQSNFQFNTFVFGIKFAL